MSNAIIKINYLLSVLYRSIGAQAEPGIEYDPVIIRNSLPDAAWIRRLQRYTAQRDI